MKNGPLRQSTRTFDSTMHLESAQVAAAFAKGMPLVENGQFKIHASRREKPGQAEMHAHDTDIFYVLEGSATLITGGTIVDPKPAFAGNHAEIRGTSISGGETHTLREGDVIIVPAGTPHWFKAVAPGPAMLYYTVKVTSSHG